MSASVEHSKPPAAAYAVMAELLGPDYFAGPPPVEGFVLEVRGRDGRATAWAMSEAVATRARIRVAADIRVMFVSLEPYSPDDEGHPL